MSSKGDLKSVVVVNTSSRAARMKKYRQFERNAGDRFVAEVVAFREVWGGTEKRKPVVQRFWYLKPDERDAEKEGEVFLNHTCWNLETPREALPFVGERVEITVKAQLGKKIRAAAWRSIGDPIDDLISSSAANQYAALEMDSQGAKWIRFLVAMDDHVKEVTEKGLTTVIYRGSTRESHRYLYSPDVMQFYGVGLIKRHRVRLELLGVWSFRIGKASFDMDGRPHSDAGTALPGRFFWHGEEVSFDLKKVDPVTGLFLQPEDVLSFLATVHALERAA